MKYLYENNLSYDGYTETETSIYISASTFNGLVQIEKNTGRKKYVTTFPGESILKNTLHHKQYKIDDRIYFMPDHAKSIHIYNLNNMSMTGIEFRKIPGFEDPIRGVDSFRDSNYIWIFFEYADNPIIKFNIETNTIEQTICISQFLPECICNRGLPVFNSPMCYYNGKVYAAVWHSNYIFAFDLVTQNVEITPLTENVELTGICIDNDGVLYCSVRKNQNILVCYNEQKRWVYRKGNGMTDLTYSNIICVDKRIFLIPNKGNAIYELRDEKLQEYYCFPQNHKRPIDLRANWRDYFSYVIEKNKIILCPFAGTVKIEIDLSTDTVSADFIQFTGDERREFLKKLGLKQMEKVLSTGNVIRENENNQLNDFIRFIVSAE